jgi:hypothetical protein
MSITNQRASSGVTWHWLHVSLPACYCSR